MNLPFVAKKIPVVVALVTVEDVAKIFCAKRLRKRNDEDPSDPARSAEGVMLPAIWSLSVGVFTPIPILPLEATLNHCALDDDAIVKRFSVFPAVPVIPSFDEGVVDPIPTLPFEDTLKNEALDEEATLRISFVEPDTPRILKATVEDVALIPATVPLSIIVPEPRVFAVTQRVIIPIVPPVIVEAAMLSDDVDTQRVDVPVVWRIIPSVPVALSASYTVPRSERFVVEARISLPFVAKKLDVDAVVAKKFVDVLFVVDELTAAKLPVAVALVKLVFAKYD